MTVNDTGANSIGGRPRPVPTTPSESPDHRTDPQPSSVSDHGDARPVNGSRRSWREHARSKPGLGHVYRVGVFVTGLLFIALGLAMAVLPGPLTIPPVLIGLWIWSTEFRFAQRLFDSFKRKGQAAWHHAKARPLSSTAITVGGLAAAGVAVWTVSHFQLIAKGQEAIGL